jgi:sarcosine oxidase/L-pipecolate oxidase
MIIVDSMDEPTSTHYLFEFSALISGHLHRREGATILEVSTKRSGKLLARKVMLATGAFTEFSDLLPRGLLPDMKICTETVILAEVSEKDQEYMR